MAALAVLAGTCYVAVRMYSPAIVRSVVEETLVQKAPPGTDPDELRRRFRSMLERPAGEAETMRIILDVASRLEKVQKLDRDDLERLLNRGL